MGEQLISFETAKLAKEKGFNVDCASFYIKEDGAYQSAGENYYTRRYDWNKPLERLVKRYSAPTQSLLQKWLREKHEMMVESQVFDPGFLIIAKFCYQWRIYNKSDSPDKTYVSSDEWRTYEEALEDGLKTALKLIKVGKKKK